MPKEKKEKSKKDELSEELQKSLKDIIGFCEKEDEEIRKAQIRVWKKHEEFWHGVQYLFWSQRDETWRSPLNLEWREEFSDEEIEEIGSFYDYVVDIFKAHGESIIAALAAQIPVMRFVPDDADSDEDVITARTYGRIADVVQRHNKAKLLFLRALFFLYISGNVASYIYKESDFKYGTYTVPTFTEKKDKVPQFVCEECEYASDTNWMEQQEPHPDLANADPTDPATGSMIPDNNPMCPQCGSVEKPKQKDVEIVTPVRGEDQVLPKTRAKVDVFGPLFFKIPYYARNQQECGYLIHYLDAPKSLVKYTYREYDKEKEIEGEVMDSSDRFARADFAHPSDPEVDQKNMVTVKKVWLRPHEFYRENDQDKREELLEKFPKGVHVVLIGKNNHFILAEEEELDKKWRIGKAGLSTYIHSDAICRPVVSLQELRNQMVCLTAETIEHGIPSEYADPAVLSFDQYGRFEAVPGYVYKAKPVTPTTPLSQSFHMGAKAVLGKEVPGFVKQIDQDAQFSLGSFPSIYGGPSEGKSRTFSEYAASRQMALQRLSILWNFVVDWWSDTMYELVQLYVDCVVEDERDVQFKDGNYVNVWIRKTELNGKVGAVESEASETFPLSLMQKKDLIMKLMELNNDFVNNALYQPENARVIQDVLALSEFKLPGEAQRVKQVYEINQLVRPGEEPIDTGQMGPDGKPMLIATVPIDEDVDDHAVHSATLRSFLVDQAGQDLLRENPAGYMNCIAHKRMHDMALLKATMKMNQTPPGVPPPTTQKGIEE